MKYFAVAIAALAAAPSVMGFTINTPSNIVQCQPFQFTWTAGQGPYYLSLIPAGQPTAPAIKVFPEQTGLTYTWIVDLPQGTTFDVALRDQTGSTMYSDQATIQPGTDSTCLNTAVTETQGSSSGGSSPSSSGSSASPSSSNSGSSTNTAGGSTQSGSAARGSSYSTFAIAGLMGLVGAALF